MSVSSRHSVTPAVNADNENALRATVQATVITRRRQSALCCSRTGREQRDSGSTKSAYRLPAATNSAANDATRMNQPEIITSDAIPPASALSTNARAIAAMSAIATRRSQDVYATFSRPQGATPSSRSLIDSDRARPASAATAPTRIAYVAEIAPEAIGR